MRLKLLTLSVSFFFLTTTSGFASLELIGASKRGELDVITAELAEGADVNYTDSLGRTPIMHAAENGQLEAVKLFIEAGADVLGVNERDDDRTVLNYAIDGGHVEVMRVLLDNGARTDTYATRPMLTPLMMARQNLEAVKLLIEYGADVNARGTATTSDSVLNYAALSSAPGVITALIEAGADPELPALHDYVAIQQAANMQNVQGITELLEAGVNPDAVGRGMTAYQISDAKGNAEAMAILEEYGASM